MGLYWCRIQNFGDELNAIIWPRLIPEIIEDKEVVLLGIGTILLESMPFDSKPRKLIFSSGIGYGKDPITLDSSWKIYCVRGPLSADALGIDRKYAITDGAVLIRRFVDATNNPKIFKFGFMPHLDTANCSGENWRILCNKEGIKYIDPRASIKDVISAITSVEVLIAEAMHGAIVADALRIPWIPVISNKRFNYFKWLDWSESMNMKFQPHYLKPLHENFNQSGYECSMQYPLLESQAMANITSIKSKEPMLSEDTHLESVTSQIEEKLSQLKSDYLAHRLAD